MNNKGIMLLKKKFGAALTAVLFVAVVLSLTGCSGKDTAMNSELPQELDFSAEASAGIQDEVPGAAGENVVEISDEAETTGSEDKMVLVSFGNAGRANPFLPVRENKSLAKADLFKFDLVEPPSSAVPDKQASKIVTTKISGIMFDNYNPSAILNIEGDDYLVRSGDVINGYKILAISPSTVTVQLGKNVYKAGVGEVVTDGAVNYNTISNLANKFGGNTGNKKKK